MCVCVCVCVCMCVCVCVCEPLLCVVVRRRQSRVSAIKLPSSLSCCMPSLQHCLFYMHGARHLLRPAHVSVVCSTLRLWPVASTLINAVMLNPASGLVHVMQSSFSSI